METGWCCNRESVQVCARNADRHEKALIGSAVATQAYLNHNRVFADEATHPVASVGGGRGLIPMSEVEKHKTKEDLWVVINGQVYDLTQVRTTNRTDLC